MATGSVSASSGEDGKFVHVSTMTENNVSTEIETRDFTSRGTQTDETALPRTLKQVKGENRVLKQRVKRQSIRLENMKDMMKVLRREQLVTEGLEEFLTARFQGNGDSNPVMTKFYRTFLAFTPRLTMCSFLVTTSNFLGLSATIFKNELKNGLNENKCTNRYSDEFKQFALTLHYNSPKAYRFLRYFYSSNVIRRRLLLILHVLLMHAYMYTNLTWNMIKNVGIACYPGCLVFV